MSERREFLKRTVALTAVTGAGVALTGCNTMETKSEGAASVSLPAGIIYTRANPGMWSKKVGGHAPVVTVKGNNVKIETKHGMSKKHFIVRHTIVTAEGEVLGDKTFSPDDLEAVSEHEIEAGHKVLFATSFCNKHDMWVESFTV